MNIQIRSLGIIALTMAASAAAHAGGHVDININPFGWGVPPPVVYESPDYYAPPPVIYSGGGHWGDDRDRRGRDHNRGRSEHHGEDDRRR